MSGQIILESPAHKYEKAQKLLLHTQPGFLLENPGLSLLNQFFPFSVNSFPHQFKTEFPSLKASKSISDIQDDILKSKLIKADEEAIVEDKILSYLDDDIVQFKIFNIKTRQLYYTTFICVKLSSSNHPFLLLKARRNMMNENIPSILQSISEYQTELDSIDLGHISQLKEVYNCFGTAFTNENNHPIEIKNVNRILNFQENLKEYIQNHNINRNNRNFISYFKTHKSPMDISIFEDKIIFGIKDFRFFPLCSICNKNTYINLFKYLINQIHQLK